MTEELLEIIHNEMVFQGVTIINQFRKEFYFDLIQEAATELDSNDFNNIILAYSNKNDDYLSTFLIRYLLKKDLKCARRRLLMKELAAKLYLTFLYNSNLNLKEDMILNMTQVLMEEKAGENQLKLLPEFAMKRNVSRLLTVIDKGCENEDSFDVQINQIAYKLSALKTKDKLKEDMPRKTFLPITQLRRYLKPTYTKTQMYDMKNSGKKFDLLKLYKGKFVSFVRKYFSYLLEDAEDFRENKQRQQLRTKLIKNFSINLFLFEDQDIISEMLEDLRNSINQKYADSQKDDTAFWSLFIEDLSTLKPNFLIYLMPHYNSCKDNPFQVAIDTKSDPDLPVYLSEFIADNDAIYKSIIFMPFASIDNAQFTSYLTHDDILKHSAYSLLTKPLDYYFANSNGLFNLDVYEINLVDTPYSKLLWGSCEIKGNHHSQTKLTFSCVDYLGLEVNEKVERIVTKPFHMKVINLFNRNLAPLNYNMTSNNGWLEVFFSEKKFNSQKMKKLDAESRANKYFEEVNYPQIDLEMVYHNYKVNEILIQTNGKMEIVYDHFNAFDIEGKGLKQNDKGSIKDYAIQIKHFSFNNENVSIPIATFTSF